MEAFLARVFVHAAPHLATETAGFHVLNEERRGSVLVPQRPMEIFQDAESGSSRGDAAGGDDRRSQIVVYGARDRSRCGRRFDGELRVLGSAEFTGISESFARGAVRRFVDLSLLSRARQNLVLLGLSS